jgi:hypothetical protein
MQNEESDGRTESGEGEVEVETRQGRIEQDTNRAVRKYFRAMTHGRTSIRRDCSVKTQVSGYQAAARAGFELGEKVKEIICRHGVPYMQFPLYRSFALHLAKLQRGYAADDFALLCCAAINRWTGYGLSNAILREVCQELFAARV